MSASISNTNWWYTQQPEHIVFPSKYYFDNLKYFSLTKYVKVFNSKYFWGRNLWNINSILKNLVEFMAKLFMSNYYGLPSIDKDHSLIILDKQ